MLRFISLIRALLPRHAKLRLFGVATAAVALAAIEALGLLMILPLIQLIAAGNQTIPPAAQWWSDTLGISSPNQLAAVLGGLVFIAFLTKGVAAVFYLRWNLGLVLTSEANTAARLLDGYLRAPYTFHLERNSAEMQRTIHESVRRVYSEALTALLGGAADAMMLLGIASVLLLVQPLVAVVAGVYFALVAVGYQSLIHKRTHAAAAQIHGETERAFQIVQQSIDAVREVQLAHNQDYFVAELRKSKQGLAREWRTILLLMQVPRYYLETALVVGFGLLSVVLFNIRSTVEATAVLGLFLAAGFRMLPSLNRVLVTLGTVRAALPAVEQITDDLTRVERPVSPAAEPLDGPAGIDLLHVSFRYQPPGPDVLSDVTLSVEPGQWIGIVGSSGSGKSTLLDLILGILEPTAGDILIGGRPLDSVRDAWQLTIGHVPQSVMVLDDSLRANIALGIEPAEIDDDAVMRAVEAAQLLDVLASLPSGIDTRIGEHGSRLSGGQRQRVGMARALYRRPAVLVLDEATSALDSETEARIATSIARLRGTMTILSVAHRLSTIQDCDEIFLLQEGALAARGDFVQLQSTSRAFAELVKLGSLTG